MTNDSVKFFEPTRTAERSKAQRASSGAAAEQRERACAAKCHVRAATSRPAALKREVGAQRERRDDCGGGEEQRGDRRSAARERFRRRGRRRR